MGKTTEQVKEFIDSIPDSRLKGFSRNITKIYSNTNFRLDMQGMTSDEPQKHNLQVRINTITSLKRIAPATVAMAHVPDDDSWTAKQVRDALIADIRV